LYAITDKSSSALGPALTGLIITLTGNIRLAFMLVVVMFICAIIVLRMLDLTRGKLDAEEVRPISPVTLSVEEETPDELRGKENDD
jgi:MFS-type transporter involved in bile tolerance (Atg22 family)